ncbi:MAG: hypothetical protein ACRDTH_08265 [Pseudonocardiaceae bacterium]
MSKHEKQDDEDNYKRNGYNPNRPTPREDPGGKHGKPDPDDKDDKDMKK